MKPVLQAILLAERVYQEVTGKKIIAGTFNQVFLNRKGRLPTAHPTEPGEFIFQGGGDMGSPSVYLSLTDCVPEIEITLRFVNVSKNQVLIEFPFKVQCPDRLATVELIIPLPPLGVFVGEAGTYTLDLIWKDELLGSHRVVAVDNTPPDQPPANEPNPNPLGGV